MSGRKHMGLRAGLLSACALGMIAGVIGGRPLMAQGQVVGRTAAESGAPHWPAAVKAPAGAPNVLLIMTDDVGFASSSAFGGPVPTPTFDALAQRGLRYNRFNTTALCSPTRASLLTGRDPHNVEMGKLTNTPTGYDGYTSEILKSTAAVPRILRDAGYSTAAFGKWHLTPERELGQSGPFDRWPTGMGFEYYYGFMGGDTDQFAPSLVENTRAIEPPHDDPDYILDRDLANRAIGWISEQHQLAPDKPFFVYYADGAAHSPHQAPKAWLDKFRGRFDQGWDVMREESFARQKKLGVIPQDTVLTPRPASLPAWSSLSADQKRINARFMEAYAAELAFSDHEIGRVIDSLRASGQLDNTLIIFIQGDNGSSAEGGVDGELVEQNFVSGFKDTPDYLMQHIDEIGGPLQSNNYPAGWAWAMNTPFQYYKQVASHFGGVRNGLVMSWPKMIEKGGAIRQQFHHVSDIAPTILDAAGVAPPASVDGVQQKPLDGVSMRYSFDHPDEPSHRRQQVFEMAQNMAIYQDGWWAGSVPAKAPWQLYDGRAVDLDTRRWELYNINADYSQAHDLAAAQPRKLAQMQQLFWAEAGRNNILPLHDSSEGAPQSAQRRSFTFTAPLYRMAQSRSPDIVGKSYRITADVECASGSTGGVLVASGGRFGGYALYLKDGVPVFHYNAIGPRQYRIAAPAPLSPGRHSIVARFQRDSANRSAGGVLSLSIDGRQAAQGRIEKTLAPWISYTEDFDIGSDSVTPVSEDYDSAHSRFAGRIQRITFDIDPD